jgi:RNA polymerase sigma-70 factor (ECF subfamily)
MKQVREKYEKAYGEFSDAIFRYCYLRVSDREKAKDIMQETFIKVWEHMNRNDRDEIVNVRAFLYKTAGHLIIDGYRKKKEESLDKLQDGGFDPGTAGHRTIEVSAELRGAIELVNELDDKYREVFIMRFVEEMSPKEIAELLNDTENNVSVKINRAMKKMKELINNGK